VSGAVDARRILLVPGLLGGFEFRERALAIVREKVYDAAMKLLAQSKFDKAVAELEKIVAEDPKDVRTILKIAETLHVKMGKRREALERYDRAASIYAETGFYLKSVAVLKQMLTIDATNPDMLIRLAEMNQQLGYVSQSQQHYQQVALLYEQQGRVRELLSILKRMVELDPENLQPRVKVAELFAQQGMFAEAATEMRAAYVKLRDLYRFDDAIRCGDRVVQWDPTALDVAREVAGFCMDRGDPRSALRHLEVCFKADSRNLEVLGLIAQAFLGTGQVAKSVSVFREMARLYEANGDVDAARLCWEKLLEHAPGDEQAENALGRRAPAPAVPQTRVTTEEEQILRMLTETDVYVKYGLRDKAIEHLRRIFSVRPDFLPALEKLKNLQVQTKQTAAAIATLARMVSLEAAVEHPRLAEWQSELARLQAAASNAPRPVSPPPPPSPPPPQPQPPAAGGQTAQVGASAPASAMAVAAPSAGEPPRSKETSGSGPSAPSPGLKSAAQLRGGAPKLTPNLNELATAPLTPSGLGPSTKSHPSRATSSNTAPPLAPPFEDDERTRLAASVDVPSLSSSRSSSSSVSMSEDRIYNPEDFGVEPELPEPQHVSDDGRDEGADDFAEDDRTPPPVRPPPPPPLSDEGHGVPEELMEPGETGAATQAGDDDGIIDSGEIAAFTAQAVRDALPRRRGGTKDQSQPHEPPVPPPGVAPEPDDEMMGESTVALDVSAHLADIRRLRDERAPLSTTRSIPSEFVDDDPPFAPPRTGSSPTVDATEEFHIGTSVSGSSSSAVFTPVATTTYVYDVGSPVRATIDANALDAGASAAGTKGPFSAAPSLVDKSVIDEPVGARSLFQPVQGFEDDPANTFFADELAEVEFFLEQELVEEARAVLEAIVDEVPDSPRVKYLLARVAAKEAGEPEPPPPWETRLLEDVAEQLSAFSAQASASGTMSQPEQISVDEVLSQFKRGVEKTVAADDAATHYDLGVAYREMGLLEDAVGEFELASRAPARAADAFYLIGLVRNEQGRAVDALTALARALASPSATPQQRAAAEYQRGVILEGTGAFREALIALKRSQKLGGVASDLGRRIAALAAAHGDPGPVDDGNDPSG
jgi:tetratricopeptide (TPR) repeat protein